MVIRVYNTLTKRLEEFATIEPGVVRMYVCGPTVQDYAHLGHAKTFIAFDVVYRFLSSMGYHVKYVRNITDVGHLREDTQEDRIIAGAAREGLSPMEVVDKYMFSFFEDMDALNVKRPSIQPRATMHIPEMLEMISVLLERGYAYEMEGSVYFDTRSYERYGQLSGIRMEELVRHRVEPAPGKRNPADFALWKRAEKGYLLKWRSPWGEGFPGWHIECSVMSMKYLGEQIDIHGGAQDLIFPHHENEIAQSECYTGKHPFVRYWMHSGFLMVRGERMSKSLGNFVTIKEALRGNTANDIRLFALSSHYRSAVDYSEESLGAAREVRSRVEDAYLRLLEAREYAARRENRGVEEVIERRIEALMSDFREALSDDFNTPKALSHLHGLVGEVNTYLDSARSHDASLIERMRSAMDGFFEVLGLVRPEPRSRGIDASPILMAILSAREELRRRGLYEAADTIREKLREAGLEIEDTSRGPRVRVKR